MSQMLDFRKIFENYVNETNDFISREPRASHLAIYNFLNGFNEDPIEFKFLNNSWACLDEEIWEHYRSDYRRISKKGVRQQIIDNADLIKNLAKEALNKIHLNKNQIKRDQFDVDSFRRLFGIV